MVPRPVYEDTVAPWLRGVRCGLIPSIVEVDFSEFGLLSMVLGIYLD